MARPRKTETTEKTVTTGAPVSAQTKARTLVFCNGCKNCKVKRADGGFFANCAKDGAELSRIVGGVITYFVNTEKTCKKE